MRLNPDEDLLLLVDIQPCFMPGGTLPVPDGDAVVPAANRLLPLFRCAAATQDWHPPGHASFASSHPGRVPFDVVDMPYGPQTLWPDHAVQGSAEAALHPGLAQERIELVLRKGCRAGIDSYSALRENDRRTPTGLEGWLRARGVRRLFLCGLAADFCVAWSAEDALAAGFQVVMVEDACRGLGLPAPGGTTLEVARARLQGMGAGFVTLAELGA